MSAPAQSVSTPSTPSLQSIADAAPPTIPFPSPARRRRWLPGPLSTKQWLYLLLPQTIGAAILDGGANFAIAYAMYHRQEIIEVWPIQHNTIAGDMAVTTFIQGILTFFIVNGLVHRDMRTGMIAPLPTPWPYAPSEGESAKQATTADRPETPPSHSPVQWFAGSDANDVFHFSLGARTLAGHWLRTALEGALLSALFFLLLWPPAIAIVAPLYQHANLAHTWTSELIKLVYGAVLGLGMNPVCALIALGSEDAVLRGRGRMMMGEADEEGRIGTERGPECAQVRDVVRPETVHVHQDANGDVGPQQTERGSTASLDAVAQAKV